LNNACAIPLSKLSSPCIKGDLIPVQIDEDVYLTYLEDCKNHLHGKITKGDKLLLIWTCEKKLNVSWKSLGSWKDIAMGK